MPPRPLLPCASLWPALYDVRERYAELAATEAYQSEEGPGFCLGTPVPVSATDAGVSVRALRSLGRNEPAIRADSSTISSIACSRSRTVSASHRRNCARRLPSQLVRLQSISLSVGLIVFPLDQDPAQVLDVVEIPGPTCCFLHSNQRRDRNETHGKPGCEIALGGIVVFSVEVEGFGNEYVNRRGLMLIAEKVQNLHALLLDPALALCLVREPLRGYRHQRTVAKARQGLKGGHDVVGSELNDQVDVHREARVLVCAHGEAPGNQGPESRFGR